MNPDRPFKEVDQCHFIANGQLFNGTTNFKWFSYIGNGAQVWKPKHRDNNGKLILFGVVKYGSNGGGQDGMILLIEWWRKQ